MQHSAGWSKQTDCSDGADFNSCRGWKFSVHSNGAIQTARVKGLLGGGMFQTAFSKITSTEKSLDVSCKPQHLFGDR